MADSNFSDSHRRRFYRDGAPYLENFETVLGLLKGKLKQQDIFIDSTVTLIRTIFHHLSECQDLLGKTEQLVEEARSNNDSPEEIEKLVSLCRDLQRIQIDLSEATLQCANKVVDDILPR